MRDKPWFKKAAAATGAVWTTPYAFMTKPPQIGITAALPVRAKDDGRLLRIFSADLTLSFITRFLRGVQLSPGSELFIVEASGELASSTDEPLAIERGSKLAGITT